MGTPAFPLENLLPLQLLMLQILEGEGVRFDEVLIDGSFPEEPSYRRKPSVGMVEKYLNELLDRENSYVIGDRLSDMQLAANMGIRGIYRGGEIFTDLPVAFCTESWLEIRDFLKDVYKRQVLDAFAKASNVVFEDRRYGAVSEVKLKGRPLILLKPNTYMNLSGKAVSYWMQKEKIALEDLLILVDDLALPFGTLRLRGQGSDGGHNGLKSIDACLGTTNRCV